MLTKICKVILDKYRQGVCLLVMVLFSAVESPSQDVDRLKGYRILITPSQFVFLDFPLTVEKIVSKFNFGATFSFKISSKDGGRVEPEGSIVGGYGYSIYPIRNSLYDGISSELNAKFYPFESRKMFFGADLFHSYFWFSNKYVSYNNVERDSFNGLRTENQSVYGLRSLVGRTVNVDFNSSHAFVFEYFGGIGIRMNYLESETRNGTINEIYYDYKYERSSYLSPIFHIGLKIGYQFICRRPL